ncbi:MAG: hypothetical protein HY692_05450 [Cyanobacteria bacterium NC_groundwater_1444_Ag_S-0.65um_54_12]|nr:hypothetical protein [Cyanobacteria bacterium NC_groundwater_1444_Ag_S-0.65um_54_12]
MVSKYRDGLSRHFWLVFVAAAVLVGCRDGANSYLQLSTDFVLPAEYADATAYTTLLTAWTRHASLGLDSGVAAIIEDPVLIAAQIAKQASEDLALSKPGAAALQFWNFLYQQGDRLPIRLRWRFSKHFYRQATAEPTKGWVFKLSDDQGSVLQPAEIGQLATARDPREWVGDFRLWFQRRGPDRRQYFSKNIRRLTLAVAGRPGNAELQWRFGPLLSARESVPLEE